MPKFKNVFFIKLVIDLIITALIIFSLFFYWQSLFEQALGCNYFGADSGRYSIEKGMMLLEAGWLGVLAHNIAWFANLSYFLSLIILFIWLILKINKKELKLISKLLFWTCMASIILGLDTYGLFLDRKMGYQKNVEIYHGFYLWILSFALFFIASCFIRWRSGRDSNPRPPA